MVADPWFWAALAMALLWLATWWWAGRRHAEGAAAREPELAALRERIAELRDDLDVARDEAERLKARDIDRESTREALIRELAMVQARSERTVALEQALHAREAELATLRHRSETLYAQAAAMKVRLDEEGRSASERIAMLERVRAEFAESFRRLAADLLDERAQRLGTDNQQQLAQILDPLRTELKDMQAQVQRAYLDEARERGVLTREIETLRGLNVRLSDEARQLTQALRGDTRVQGGWGEAVLTRVLESAGLVEHQHYSIQQVYRDEGGGRPRPDVIVHLPQQRELVLDAKVSLTAYERAISATVPAQRQAAMDEHLQSLRRHIEGLARRDYAGLLHGRTLDLVLMFVPIESALVDAMRHDPALAGDALERGIALVSPSTLLLQLRVVAELWKQEQRYRHAQEIADRAGRLYDRFVGFVADLDQAREAQQRALHELDQACAKLKTGRGNLIRQAEQLRELGARHQKRLPTEWVDGAEDSPPADTTNM